MDPITCLPLLQKVHSILIYCGKRWKTKKPLCGFGKWIEWSGRRLDTRGRCCDVCASGVCRRNPISGHERHVKICLNCSLWFLTCTEMNIWEHAWCVTLTLPIFSLLCPHFSVKYSTLDLGFLREGKQGKTCCVRQDFDVDASFQSAITKALLSGVLQLSGVGRFESKHFRVRNCLGMTRWGVPCSDSCVSLPFSQGQEGVVLCSWGGVCWVFT